MEESAFLAYYFHWTHDDVMAMPHHDRIRWCKELSKINRKLNHEPENMFENF